MGQLSANIDFRISCNYRFDAKIIRDMYAEYCATGGAIPRQGKKIKGNVPDVNVE